MFSPGVYVEALEGMYTLAKHKYFWCLADAKCRLKKMIPCKGGDRSNVNAHLKTTHGLQGMGGIVKGQKGKKETIDAHLEAARTRVSTRTGVCEERLVFSISFLERAAAGGCVTEWPLIFSRVHCC